MGAEEVTVMVKKAKVNAYVYSCVTSEKQVKDEIIAYLSVLSQHLQIKPLAVEPYGSIYHRVQKLTPTFNSVIGKKRNFI